MAKEKTKRFKDNCERNLWRIKTDESTHKENGGGVQRFNLENKVKQIPTKVTTIYTKFLVPTN